MTNLNFKASLFFIHTVELLIYFIHLIMTCVNVETSSVFLNFFITLWNEFQKHFSATFYCKIYNKTITYSYIIHTRISWHEHQPPSHTNISA